MSPLTAQRLGSLARRAAPVMVAVLAFLLLWQLAATRAGNDQHILPPPGTVWQALLAQREPLTLHAGVTLWETLVGFGAALAAGVVAGVTLDASPWLRQALYPLLVASQTVPIITLAPLLVLWLGFGLASKAVVVLLVCFFPIAVALADGLRATDPELVKLFRTFGARRWRIFWLVRLPGALPSLFSGVRIAVTYSVIGAIFSEYVGASAGLGFFMQQKQKGFAVPAVIAAIAVTALLSIALFALVTLIERLSLPWFFQTRVSPSRKVSSMSRVKRPIIAILALVALSLALTACGGTSPAGPTQPVTLALDWTPNTNHTGIYVAQQKGYYATEGLSLTLTPYSSNVTPEQLVSTGQATFGISFTESVTSARATGLDVVSVAAVIQHNTSALVTLRSSGLDSINKLQGKKYAGFGAAYEQPVIQKILSCAGVGKPSFENVTTDLDPIVALKSGKFDFAWIYSGWEGIEAQRQGIALNVFPLSTTCMPDYYSPVIITSGKMLHDHPDMVRHFLAATAKGYTFATRSPHEAADLLLKGAPSGTFDDKQLVYDSQDYLSPRYADGASCWGTQTTQKWTDYPKLMFASGAILGADGKPITKAPDYAAAFSNAYLPSC